MIGRTLKNYVVEEMLGKGGMGVVYRARDTRLNRRVALKVLPPELVRDEDRRRRFVEEAKAASAVNHPAIAQIYEIEDDGDVTFIVMEYVDGSTLHELVARRELDLASAVEVAILVGDALARAHEAGIVHRDIKPDNIMVTRDGHPKILDFGLAKLLDVASGADAAQASRLETLVRTHAGLIVGTLAYMSPEQARGQAVDRRSDIFSFGIVLYEAATGRLPFEKETALDTMHAIAYETPQPVTTIRAEVPYALQKVIERCMQKRPEDRYQDIRACVADLKAVKREVETGVTGGMPVLERVKWWIQGLSTRGMIWGAVYGAVLGGLAVAVILGVGAGRVFPIIGAIGLGALMFRRFRNRGVREMRKFVRRASGLKEVRLITFHKGQFTVVAENPAPKTYLKLNAYLETANSRLFRGEPMTMVVRDDVDDKEMRRILSDPGVQFVREAGGRASRVARGAAHP